MQAIKKFFNTDKFNDHYHELDGEPLLRVPITLDGMMYTFTSTTYGNTNIICLVLELNNIAVQTLTVLDKNIPPGCCIIKDHIDSNGTLSDKLLNDGIIRETNTFINGMHIYKFIFD